MLNVMTGLTGGDAVLEGDVGGWIADGSTAVAPSAYCAGTAVSDAARDGGTRASMSVTLIALEEAGLAR